MREIKFRAKTVTTNGWAYGHHAFVDGYHVIYENNRPLIIQLNTLGEYTGLKDKNGREIYEGDLYSFKIETEMFSGSERTRKLNNTFIKVVEYKHGAFYHGADLLVDVIEYDDSFEYVGNIYENSDLL